MDTFGSRLPDGIRSSSPTPPGSCWRGFGLRYGLMSETPACSDRSGRAAIVAPVTAPHRKGPLRDETPKKWTAEGAFAPPGNNRSARRHDSSEGDVFMTVSSTISVYCRDGMFRSVYCHLHGEPSWNGRILHTHYATGQQAEALITHGDIRCLGPRCDKPAGHTLQHPAKGVTSYYGRDSNLLMDSEAREYRSLTEALATESTPEVRFHYLFIDGYWKVMYRSPEGWKMKSLALALRRCQE